MSKRRNRKTKANNGSGSFSTYAKANGEQVMRYIFTYTDLHGQSKRKSVTGISEPDCIKKKNDFLNKVNANLSTELENATIPDLLYIAYEKACLLNKCSAPGRDRNESTRKIFFKLPVEKPIGLIPIKDITENDLLRFYYELPKRYSQSVINKIHIALNKAFELAIEKKIIDVNIHKNSSIAKPNSTKLEKEVLALSENEISTLFEALDNHKYRNGENDFRLQYRFELTMGMRMGEINALTIDDIDLEKNIIYVNKTISKGPKQFIKPCPKTKESNRRVPISNEARPYVEQAIAKYIDNPYRRLFFNRNSKREEAGGSFLTQSVNDKLRKVCEENGLPFYGQHMLRHTFATKYAKMGVSLPILRDILGHSDINTTAKFYINNSDQDKLDSLNSANNNKQG